MPKISYIIPVYKMEKYLERLYISLKDQTLEDFEAVFIDDGSPDKSGEIIESFAKNDSRVKLIKKKNGGVSSARNVGLDVATGKYIIFLDPDDWMERDSAKELYETAEHEDADVVMYGFVNEIYDRNGTKIKQSISLPSPAGVFRGEPFKKYFDKFAASYLVIGKMYKRELLEKDLCRFENRNIGEDGLFHISVYSKNPKCLVVLEKPYYHYTAERRSSLSNSFHSERLEDNFYLSNAAFETVKKWGLTESKMHIDTVKYCTVRDLQMGIKNVNLGKMRFSEKHSWLKKTMTDNWVKMSVKDTPLSAAGGRNDKIKLMLLKMRMYRTVILVSALNRK